MLKIRSLDVFYGSIQAVQNIALHIKPGEYVTIIGANGAGKTTLLATISGLIAKCSGTIEYEGHQLVGMTPESIVNLGICHVPEGRRVFAPLSVADNLLLGGYTTHRKFGKSEVARLTEMVYQQFPRLAERRKQYAGTLSGGEQQMLAIGRALMGKPRLLLMDEPSMGLAPLITDEIFAHIASLRADGLSVLMVEQNAKKALQLCDRGYVLENGQFVMEGASEKLLHSNEIKRAYLGKDYKEKWEK